MLIQVNEITYELALPPSQSAMHPNVSCLLAEEVCDVLDGSHRLLNDKLDVRPELSY